MSIHSVSHVLHAKLLSPATLLKRSISLCETNMCVVKYTDSIDSKSGLGFKSLTILHWSNLLYESYLIDILTHRNSAFVLFSRSVYLYAFIQPLQKNANASVFILCIEILPCIPSCGNLGPCHRVWAVCLCLRAGDFPPSRRVITVFLRGTCNYVQHGPRDSYMFSDKVN